MEIVRIESSEVPILLSLSWRTFHDSFYHHNTPENMNAYMSKAFTIEKLLSELLNPFSEFYFARTKKETVGFIKLNKDRAQSDLNDDLSLEIERIYIDRHHQGKGYGADLLNFAKKRALELGLHYIWLGVWEKNIDAIRFYQRHDFEIFSSHPFIFGDEVQTDLLMRCCLTPVQPGSTIHSSIHHNT